MTYLLIAWLYASGALLAHGLIVANDEMKPCRKRDHIGRLIVAATWPVWALVGIFVTVTGIARP